MGPLRILSISAAFGVSLLLAPAAWAHHGGGGHHGSGGGGGGASSYHGTHSSSVHNGSSGYNGPAPAYHGPSFVSHINAYHGPSFVSHPNAYHGPTFSAHHAATTSTSLATHHSTTNTNTSMHANQTLSFVHSSKTTHDADDRDPDHDGDADHRDHDRIFFNDGFVGPFDGFYDYGPYGNGTATYVVPFPSYPNPYRAPAMAGGGPGGISGYAVTAAPVGTEAVGIIPGTVDYFAPVFWYSMIGVSPWNLDWYAAYLAMHMIF